MPAIANIVIADGQPTPVNRTFAPLGVSSDLVATYENRSTGIQVGYDTLSLGFRRANGKSHNNKLTLKLSLPILEVTSPATSTGIQPQPTRAYSCDVFVDFVCSDRSTTQDRKNLVTLLRNALVASGVVDTCFQNLESVY